MSTMARVNFRFVLVWCMCNAKEIQALIAELSVLYPTRMLHEMYQTAIEDPHSFWYVNLVAKDKQDVFFRPARTRNINRLERTHMADPATNLTQAQADKVVVWESASKTYVNLQTSIMGLAPSTLSTLQALAAPVGNDPQFSTNVAATTTALQASISSKAPWHLQPSPGRRRSWQSQWLAEAT